MWVRPRGAVQSVQAATDPPFIDETRPTSMEVAGGHGRLEGTLFPLPGSCSFHFKVGFWMVIVAEFCGIQTSAERPLSVRKKQKTSSQPANSYTAFI